MTNQTPEPSYIEMDGENLASVSGPPSDSTMNTLSKKTHVKPVAEIVKKTDPIMTNENYIIDQFGVFYRPIYVEEKIDLESDEVFIFANKYYTTEGVGNCQLCSGSGKVIVEKMGVRDCPDCDGTGDIQQGPPVFEESEFGAEHYDKDGTFWFTTKNGRRVGIKKGQTLEDALNDAGIPNDERYGADVTASDLAKNEDDGKPVSRTAKPKKRFTLKDYEKNEDQNEHTKNALLLVKQYGTPEEIKEMEEISKRHEEQNRISSEDSKRRYEISNKYYNNLRSESEKSTDKGTGEDDGKSVSGSGSSKSYRDMSDEEKEGSDYHNNLKRGNKERMSNLSQKTQDKIWNSMGGKKDIDSLNYEDSLKLWNEHGKYSYGTGEDDGKSVSGTTKPKEWDDIQEDEISDDTKKFAKKFMSRIKKHKWPTGDRAEGNQWQWLDRLKDKDTTLTHGMSFSELSALVINQQDELRKELEIKNTRHEKLKNIDDAIWSELGFNSGKDVYNRNGMSKYKKAVQNKLGGKYDSIDNDIVDWLTNDNYHSLNQAIEELKAGVKDGEIEDWWDNASIDSRSKLMDEPLPQFPSPSYHRPEYIDKKYDDLHSVFQLAIRARFVSPKIKDTSKESARNSSKEGHTITLTKEIGGTPSYLGGKYSTKVSLSYQSDNDKDITLKIGDKVEKFDNYNQARTRFDSLESFAEESRAMKTKKEIREEISKLKARLKAHAGEYDLADDASEEALQSQIDSLEWVLGEVFKAEENIAKYKNFISQHMIVLQQKAKVGEAVNMMYGVPTSQQNGKKIKGTLAYAGVSLNNRIYLPEALARGDGLTLPLLLNHASTSGAENELWRLADDMVEALENEQDYQVGEVTLTWDPKKLTLFYDGVVTHPFFQKEIVDANMAVSLGIYYDSNSPQVCDEQCYTLIKGAEFREVSLVYHAGFPIATIEAVEAELKNRTMTSFANEEIAEEELDQMPEEQIIDVREKPTSEPQQVIILNDSPTDDDLVGETMLSPTDFSVRGVTGLTISNINGVQKYQLEPLNGYETNTIHLHVAPSGASIFGENFQLQPQMATPEDITSQVKKKPDIIIENSDKDVFTKLKKNQIF